MSQKAKHVTISEGLPGEKLLINKLIRLENSQAARKGAGPRLYTEKLSQVARSPSSMQPQRFRPKPIPSPIPTSPIFNNLRQQAPVAKNFATPRKEEVIIAIKEPKAVKPRKRSVSEARESKEAWGQLLMTNKSKDKVSNFGSFDPLRTLHFLSKELHTKVNKLAPGNQEVLTMIADIQHALKRIPPDVSTALIHKPNEVPKSVPKHVTTKICQTPPTMYQEDTEKFKVLMEENTYRLEASCKQLELVCTNLQNEKEVTEKDLDEARENIGYLCTRVKELEHEIELVTTLKMSQLEEEKRQLQLELDKAINQINSNSSVEYYKKMAEDLKRDKAISDDNCARLEYDMTLLKMEKEKFVTLLGVRDKEIKDIQDEMSKIQEQVNLQLKKLSCEVMQRASSMSATGPIMRSSENLFVEIGDTTLSSITTNASENSVIKESPCGDGEDTGAKDLQANALHKLKAECGAEFDAFTEKEKEGIFDDLLAGLSPSLRCLLTSNNQ